MQQITTPLRKCLINQSFLAAVMVLLTFFSTKSYAQFTPGNIIVSQAGNGSVVTGAKSVPVILNEYNTTSLNQAAPVSVVAIPTTGTGRLTVTRNAAIEAQITLSADSNIIVVAGYDADPFTAAIGTTASATYNRVLDTINRLSMVGRAASTTQFDGTNVRSGVKGTADDYWMAGGNSGTVYPGNTSAAAIVQSTKTNTRVEQIFNSNLYFSTSAGTTATTPRGIYKMAGQPTNAAIPSVFINTGDTSSPVNFAIDPTETIAYITDNDTGVGSIGGVQKWILDPITSLWINVYTIPVGIYEGAVGLAVDFSGATPVIYSTATDNTLVKVTDIGAASIYEVLATAPANTFFRGVAFTPKALCLPTITFANTNVTCNGGTDGAIVTTTINGMGTFGYAWAGPSGFSSTSKNLSNISAGVYALTLTSTAGCSTTVLDTITQPAAITLTNVGSNAPICAGQNLNFTSNVSNPLATFTWSGPNSFVSTLQNPVITNATTAASGTYTLTAHFNGCSSTVHTTTVVVHPTPFDTIVAAGPTTVCYGDTVGLSVNNVATYTYQWQIDGQNIPGANSYTYTTDTGGSFTVVITNTNNCPHTSAAVPVTVIPLPVAVVSPEGTTTVCPGGTLILDAATGPNYTYQWLSGNTFIPGATNASYTVTMSGTYSVIVSAGACSTTSAPLVVDILQLPAILPQNPTTFCWGSSALLQVQEDPTVATQYQWQLNGNNISGATNNTYQAYQPGNYTINVNFIGVCLANSAVVNITVNELPDPIISENGAILTTTDFVTYQWYQNTVVIPGANEISLPITTNGDYYVTVTDVNGCTGISEPYVLQDLAVASAPSNASIHIYPNPATDVLHVQSATALSATIASAEGKVVLQVPNATDINVGGLANGLYILTLTDNEGQVVKMQKLLKENK